MSESEPIKPKPPLFEKAPEDVMRKGRAQTKAGREQYLRMLSGGSDYLKTSERKTPPPNESGPNLVE